jgi:hypothetical protein
MAAGRCSTSSSTPAMPRPAGPPDPDHGNGGAATSSALTPWPIPGTWTMSAMIRVSDAGMPVCRNPSACAQRPSPFSPRSRTPGARDLVFRWCMGSRRLTVA